MSAVLLKFHGPFAPAVDVFVHMILTGLCNSWPAADGYLEACVVCF